MKEMIVVVVVLALLALTACQSFDEKDAVEIAEAEIVGFVSMPDDVVPEVEFFEDRIVVTFPTNYEAPTVGADYHAQVIINKSNKEIIQVLVGS